MEENPAPVEVGSLSRLSHYLQGFIYPSVVQDFFHQQYDSTRYAKRPSSAMFMKDAKRKALWFTSASTRPKNFGRWSCFSVCNHDSIHNMTNRPLYLSSPPNTKKMWWIDLRAKYDHVFIPYQLSSLQTKHTSATSTNWGPLSAAQDSNKAPCVPSRPRLARAASNWRTASRSSKRCRSRIGQCTSKMLHVRQNTCGYMMYTRISLPFCSMNQDLLQLYHIIYHVWLYNCHAHVAQNAWGKPALTACPGIVTLMDSNPFRNPFLEISRDHFLISTTNFCTNSSLRHHNQLPWCSPTPSGVIWRSSRQSTTALAASSCTTAAAIRNWQAAARAVEPSEAQRSCGWVAG